MAANLLTAERLIREAAEQGAEFVVLPENFALMGKTEQDKLIYAEQPGSGQLQDFLAEQSKRHGIWLVGGTIPMASPDPARVFAASLLFNDKGEQVARYDKIHLFDVEIIESGESYTESETILNGGEVVVVDSPFGRIGMSICYDLRFPELYRQLLEEGAEIIVVPSAFTDATGKAHWEVLLRARAIENLSYVVAAAQGGYHVNGRATHGHSMIVDPWGTMIAHHTSTAAAVVCADVKTEYLATTRRSFPTIDHRRIGLG